ncbi:MAG: hypothetical protein ACXWKY_15745 [Caulobacteraceae bacterium]
MRKAAFLAMSALAFASFVSDASGQAPATTAPAPAPAPPPDTSTDVVVLSRTDNTQAVESNDVRLVLSKDKREEHAIIRRLIFIAAALRLTEPAAWAGDGPAPQTCRFEYKSFLQRQQCFVSMSGVLACTQAEVTPLPEAATGDAPAPANAQPGFCNDVFRPAVNTRIRLTNLLHDRAAELFAADQKAKVELLFKAAGLTARPDLPPGLQAPSKLQASPAPAAK